MAFTVDKVWFKYHDETKVINPDGSNVAAWLKTHASDLESYGLEPRALIMVKDGASVTFTDPTTGESVTQVGSCALIYAPKKGITYLIGVVGATEVTDVDDVLTSYGL